MLVQGGVNTINMATHQIDIKYPINYVYRLHIDI